MTDYRHIVRIGNTDIDGTEQVLHGMTDIKGVDIMFANAVCRVAGVDVRTPAGELDDDIVEQLDDIVQNPNEHDIPAWLLNRRKDIRTGEDLHLLGGDIDFTLRQDIKRLKEAKTYRGIRHAQDLTTRGQRTKGNFRSNKGKGPGVKKRRVKE
jgi:small subunit ribosomal protein S13